MSEHSCLPAQVFSSVPDPAGELIALPRPPSWIYGAHYHGKEGWKGREREKTGEGRVRKGRKRKGGNGEERKGEELRHGCCGIDAPVSRSVKEPFTNS